MKALLIAREDWCFQHQRDAMRALASGMRRCGIETRIKPAPAYPHFDDDFLVTWGDKIETQASGVPRLILEAGYINGSGGSYNENRQRFISTSWNHRHGLSDWAWPNGVNGERWDALGIKLQPWKQDGEYVLLLEQTEGDTAAPDVEQFRRQIAQECTRRKWRWAVRRHPCHYPNQRTLAEDLAGARLAITWCSTAAVEAVIAGVPTYALGPGSIAAPVTMRSLSDAPYMGDRTTWANRLAYRQWALAELADGSAWPHIQSGLQ